MCLSFFGYLLPLKLFMFAASSVLPSFFSCIAERARGMVGQLSKYAKAKSEPRTTCREFFHRLGSRKATNKNQQKHQANKRSRWKSSQKWWNLRALQSLLCEYADDPLDVFTYHRIKAEKESKSKGCVVPFKRDPSLPQPGSENCFCQSNSVWTPLKGAVQPYAMLCNALLSRWLQIVQKE